MQVTNQDFLTFKAASAYLPNRPHVSTVWRWATRGVKGHQLESWIIGGTRYTSVHAIADFLSKINNKPVSLDKNRAKHLQQVSRELDAELS